jgi:CRISPR-associated protein Cas5h
MQIVEFAYYGRIGHFLRAEATANALTYPVPPRTSLMGLVGCVMGFEKDESTIRLSDAEFAVCGAVPNVFWHKANMRKELPNALPFSIKRSDKGSSAAELNTRIPQEMLWQPRYRIYASLPDSIHEEFVSRLQERRWYFNPCLGLSELLAQLDFISEGLGVKLPSGEYSIQSVLNLNRGELIASAARVDQLAIHKIRMPREVTSDRVFSHEAYLLERSGKPFTIRSDHVWALANQHIVFM